MLFFQYIHLQNLTVGNLAYELVDGEYAPLSVCQEFYRKSNVFPGNATFDIDPRTEKGTGAKTAQFTSPIRVYSGGFNPKCLAVVTEADWKIILIPDLWKEEVCFTEKRTCDHPVLSLQTAFPSIPCSRCTAHL